MDTHNFSSLNGALIKILVAHAELYLAGEQLRVFKSTVNRPSHGLFFSMGQSQTKNSPEKSEILVFSE